MTRKAKIVLWVAVPVVSLAGTALWAAGATDGPGGRPGLCGPLARLVRGNIGRFMTLQSELNVTGEQRGQIRAIFQSHRSEIAPVVQKIVEKRRALRTAVLADNPNDQAIRTAASELGQAIADAAVLASKVAGEVRPILTQEQRDRIHRFRAERDDATDVFLQKLLEP